MAKLHSNNFTLLLKRGTLANLNTANNKSIAVQGEPAYTTDSKQVYIFDGTDFIPISARHAVVVKTADYTATTMDEVIVCNKSGTMTITLPAATGLGKCFTVKSINSTVIVDGNSAETIDGELTQIINKWDSITVCDYASGVWIIK